MIGSILGLAQYKIKRLLAYSTISHVGLILLALGNDSINGLESTLFYITQYTITSLNTFLRSTRLLLKFIFPSESFENGHQEPCQFTAHSL